MAVIPTWQSWNGVFPSKVVPSKPAHLAEADFTTLGTKVKRLTDFTWLSNNAANFDTSNDRMSNFHYSRRQVWNSDQSRILLFGAWRWCVMLNADGTYNRTLQQAGIDRCWSNTSPHHIYTVDTSDYSQVYKVDVRDDSKTLVVDTPWNLDQIGLTEGNISNDDRYLVSTVNDGGNIRVVLIDILNTSYSSFTISRSYSELDWASISSEGGYIVVAYNSGLRDIDLYSLAGSKIRRICYQQHADLGTDSNGDECLVVVGHTVSGETGYPGTAVVKHRLSDDQKTLLFGGNDEFPNVSGQPVLDGHISASALEQGIAVVTSYSSSGGPHVVFGVKDDGSKDVVYYGFHNSSVTEYDDQPHGNVSRDGTMAIFKSNWANSSGHTETYIAYKEATSNTAPVLTDPADQTISDGQQKSIQLVANDAENNPLTFSLTGTNPAWATCSTSGLVTWNVPSGTTEGNYSTFVKCNDGTVDSNTVEIVVTVTAADPYAYLLDISGGQQTRDTGLALTNIGRRTIAGSGDANWNPGIVAASAKDGDEQAAYADMLGKINSLKNITHNGEYVYKNFMIYMLWKWLEPGYKNYSSGGGWTFINNVLATLNQGQGFCIMIRDRRFGASDISKTPIPSDLVNTTYSYFSENNLATANLAHPYVIDRKLDLYAEFASRYNDDQRVVFVSNIESAIELPSGNITDRNNNSVSHKESYFNELKYFQAQAKTSLTKIPLLIPCNFLGTFDSRTERQLFEELLDHAVTVGGCGLSCSDAIACNHPAQYVVRCCDHSYTVDVYTLFNDSAYQSALIMAPQCQTYDVDHTRFDEDYAMMTDGAGVYSFHSHYPILWPTGFYSRCYKYTDGNIYNGEVLDFEAVVRAEIINNPDSINTTVPTSLAVGGSTTVGTNPTYLSASFSGSDLLMTPASNATVTSTDTFSMWVGETEYTASITFYDSDPGGVGDSDGQLTTYPFIVKELSAADVTTSGTPNWIESTLYPGYSGDRHLISANGSNQVSPYQTGDYIYDDLTTLPPGNHYLYLRISSANVSSDSLWAEKNGVALINGGDQYIPFKNYWEWQAVKEPGSEAWEDRPLTTFSSSDGWVKLRPREPGAGLDKLIFIPVEESMPPTGKDGYYLQQWPGISQIDTLPDINVLENQGVHVECGFTIDPAYNSYSGSVKGYIGESESGNVFIENVAFVTVGTNTNKLVADIQSDLENTYTIKFTIDVDGNLLESSFQLIVTDPSTAVWPEGVSATLPATRTVTVGGTLGIDADPQNIPEYSLLGDRWSVSNSNLSIQSSTDEVATFVAESIGTCTISYTMIRDDNPADPVIYNTLVTITAPTSITQDTFKVENDLPSVELDVLQNDYQSRIVSFTQPLVGVVALSSDGLKLDYTPQQGYVGQTSFNYTADDGAGNYVATTTVTLNIVDPVSFDASVIVSIGVDRWAIRGNSVPFEAITVRNPENYDIAYNWSFEGIFVASWKDGVTDKQYAVLEVSDDDVVLSDIVGSVHLDVSEA